ncbi:ABC transporter permease [Paenibacillus sacheonensis]|uniref:Iron export ABC transporter permease subunit FetB n=1 Tax=Paenibacillus sacheonensis TaxID=742054 RepID=A0A7X4YKS5_9BACL|nr:iron export ABC transporter permease subunit FetB [Paenibacillus sacheonensis]MBM7563246.1 putative ABC transport system permease protein [Paenibacillus sacheonensis]NBC68195.1 iron export ABC transporter permease subunit FetB [Paenibacillus sacheonensis]
MSLTAVAFTLLFVGITVFVSMRQKLGLERDIIIGTIRAAVQLMAVGLVLQAVFRTEHLAVLLPIIIAMIAVAAWHAAGRGKGLSGIAWRIGIAIAATEAMIMLLLLGLHIIASTPQYVISISGMTIGNAMVVAGLFLNQMKRDVESSRGEIETLLALGASVRQAIQLCMKRAVKASLIPTIDGMKTVGIVQLPGMMTGMIIAGADPMQAVRYQILIVFAFTSSAAVTSIILSLLSYKLWFTEAMQLRRLGNE